jgi:hypothetical protein
MMKSRSALLKDFTKPLLINNPDIALNSDMIFIKYFSHFIIFIMLFNSSRKNFISPEIIAAHTFTGKDYISLKSRNLLPLDENQSSPNRLWYMDKDDEIGLRFKAMVEEHALPFLRGIRSLADYEYYVNNPNVFSDMVLRRLVIEQAILDAGLGRFEAARAACRKLIAGEQGMAPHLMADRLRLLTELAPPLFADDKPGVAAVLHRWEEHTIKACGLEKHWQKTPFPFEEGAGAGA